MSVLAFKLPLTKGGAAMSDEYQLSSERDREVLRAYLCRRLKELEGTKNVDEGYWLAATMEVELAMDELLGEEVPT